MICVVSTRNLVRKTTLIATIQVEVNFSLHSNWNSFRFALRFQVQSNSRERPLLGSELVHSYAGGVSLLSKYLLYAWKAQQSRWEHQHVDGCLDSKFIYHFKEVVRLNPPGTAAASSCFWLVYWFFNQIFPFKLLRHVILTCANDFIRGIIPQFNEDLHLMAKISSMINFLFRKVCSLHLKIIFLWKFFLMKNCRHFSSIHFCGGMSIVIRIVFHEIDIFSLKKHRINWENFLLASSKIIHCAKNLSILSIGCILCSCVSLKNRRNYNKNVDKL